MPNETDLDTCLSSQGCLTCSHIGHSGRIHLFSLVCRSLVQTVTRAGTRELYKPSLLAHSMPVLYWVLAMAINKWYKHHTLCLLPRRCPATCFCLTPAHLSFPTLHSSIWPNIQAFGPFPRIRIDISALLWTTVSYTQSRQPSTAHSSAYR